MFQVGKLNTLKAIRQAEQGWYLVEQNSEESILLPNKYVPADLQMNDSIEVFIYNDSEDRLIATTLRPRLYVDEFAPLLVKHVSKIGAFLDIGLEKDLLVPFREQGAKMEEGRRYVIYMYLDDVTNRLVGSAKLDKFMPEQNEDFEIGQQVKALVYKRTDLGYKAIIDGLGNGLFFYNQIHQKISVGDYVTAYVHNLRDDGKLDLILNKQGYDNIDPMIQKLKGYILANDGIIQITDKSSPEDIKDLVGMSKKQFKKALGSLYKDKKVKLNTDSVEWID